MVKKEDYAKSDWIMDDAKDSALESQNPTLYQRYFQQKISEVKSDYYKAGSFKKIVLFIYYISIGWVLIFLSVLIQMLLDFNNFLTTFPLVIFSKKTADYSQ